MKNHGKTKLLRFFKVAAKIPFGIRGKLRLFMMASLSELNSFRNFGRQIFN